MKLSKQDRIAVIYLSAMMFAAAGIIVVWTITLWPRCNPDRDGWYYGLRGGGVEQCQCHKGAAEWDCKMVDR